MASILNSCVFFTRCKVYCESYARHVKVLVRASFLNIIVLRRRKYFGFLDDLTGRNFTELGFFKIYVENATDCFKLITFLFSTFPGVICSQTPTNIVFRFTILLEVGVASVEGRAGKEWERKKESGNGAGEEAGTKGRAQRDKVWSHRGTCAGLCVSGFRHSYFLRVRRTLNDVYSFARRTEGTRRKTITRKGMNDREREAENNGNRRKEKKWRESHSLVPPVNSICMARGAGASIVFMLKTISQEQLCGFPK